MSGCRRNFASVSRLPGTQRIPRAAPTAFQPAQHTARQQVVDVAQRRVSRALAQCGPFGVGQLAFKAVQRAVQDLGLPGVQDLSRFVLHAGLGRIRLKDSWNGLFGKRG